MGVAAHGKRSDLRAVFFGLGDRPQLVEANDLEAVPSKLDTLAARGDLHASAATKLHLVKVLAGRVLKDLAA